MFYVYMLKSITTGIKKTYVGYTNDIALRLIKHNNGTGAKSTKGYKWIVIFKKKFQTKSPAMSFEYQLKNNKKLRNELLSKYDNSSK
jgi:putative endonuclease